MNISQKRYSKLKLITSITLLFAIFFYFFNTLVKANKVKKLLIFNK